MDTIKNFEIDLLRPPKTIPQIRLVQGDYYTRKFRITLLADGKPWPIPDDAIVGIRYRKPDGTTGSYDTLPDNQAAFSFSENILFITLAPQVLTAAGCVNAQLEITQGTQILASYLFQLLVEEDPSRPITASQDYFNWQHWAQAQFDAQLMRALTEGMFTPQLSIGSVSTLPAGSAATAQIHGTAAAPVLDLGIPAGPQGQLDSSFTLTGYGADAKATGDALRKVDAFNLLDNSDFRNPVNQRGQAQYFGAGYTIDRWLNYWGKLDIYVEDGYLKFVNNTSEWQEIEQRFPYGTFDTSKKYTFVKKGVDGVYDVRAADIRHYPAEGLDVVYTLFQPGEVRLEWAALYEGEFNLGNFPIYKPKGYAAELMECRRYYQELDYYALGMGYTGSGGDVTAFVNTGIQMRVTPTLIANDTVYVRCNGNNKACSFSSAQAFDKGNAATVRLVFIANGGIEAFQAAAFYSNGKVALSADL